MWIPAQTTTPPLPTAAERGGNQLAGGGEDDRAVELLRRALQRAAGPLGAELAGEVLRARRRPARVNANTLRPSSAGDLGDDVRRGAEPVEADPRAVAGKPQRAVADQPGAEQRRDLEIAVALGQREAVAPSTTANSA